MHTDTQPHWTERDTVCRTHSYSCVEANKPCISCGCILSHPTVFTSNVQCVRFAAGRRTDVPAAWESHVHRAWCVVPKQPGLESSRLRCLGALQQMVYQRRRFTTLNQLKQAIVTEWGKLSQRFIGQWRRRLECVVQQQGGHIEHLM